jgi:hypothetical protein
MTLRQRGIIACVGLFAAACLFLTSAPGIETEDSAEFAVGGRTLSMVHAPGYPLYLLAGRLASSLDTYPGRGMVLLSIFFATLAVVTVAATVTKRAGIAPGAAAGLSVLFAQGFWEAGSGIEVYTAQTFLMASLFASLMELRDHPGGRAVRLAGFVIGLTLAHHMGLLILLPAVLLFAWWAAGRHGAAPEGIAARDAATLPDRVGMRDLAAAAGYAAAGVSAYFALITLSRRPGMPIVWWPPIPDLPTLLYIMSGAAFKKLLFAVPLSEAASRMAGFPLRLAFWFPVLSLLLAVSGVRALWRSDRSILVLLLAVIAITITHAANYNVLDPEVFLMPAVVPIALLAGFGMKGLEDSGVSQPMQSTGCALLIVSAILGRMLSGGILAASYNTIPVDVSRAVLRAHDVRPPADDLDSDVIWADWRYFPTLRYFQITEGLGARALVELDSTAESPGLTYRPGQTWSMRPTPELGRHFRLVMEDFHWRCETRSGKITAAPFDTAATSSDTPLMTFSGLDLLEARRPTSARFGEPVSIELVFRRNADVAGDTVSGEIELFWGDRRRLATPFRPFAWSTPVAAIPRGAVFREPVQTLVPSAHRNHNDIADFTIRVRLTDGLRSVYYNAGKIEMEK